MSTALVTTLNSEPAIGGAGVLGSTLLPIKDPTTFRTTLWSGQYYFHFTCQGMGAWRIGRGHPSHTASQRPGCMGAGTHPASSISLYRLHEEVASFLSPQFLVSANNMWEDEDMEVGADIPWSSWRTQQDILSLKNNGGVMWFVFSCRVAILSLTAPKWPSKLPQVP